MARRKTPEEKRLEKERVAQFHQRVYNNSIKKKADELNKIMSRKDVKRIDRSDHWWIVHFKNGQVFKFIFHPPHLFTNQKIVPLLLDPGVRYGNQNNI